MTLRGEVQVEVLAAVARERVYTLPEKVPVEKTVTHLPRIRLHHSQNLIFDLKVLD